MVDFPCAVKAMGGIGNQNAIRHHLNGCKSLRMYRLDIAAKLINGLQAVSSWLHGPSESSAGAHARSVPRIQAFPINVRVSAAAPARARCRKWPALSGDDRRRCVPACRIPADAGDAVGPGAHYCCAPDATMRLFLPPDKAYGEIAYRPD